MKIQVLYTTNTGNTELIAKSIYQAITDPSKDIQRLESFHPNGRTQLYLIGFWVDRGSAPIEVLDFLSSLHHSQVALFATCGTGNTSGYYRQIENTVSAFLPEDNRYLGAYFCQGKMPMRIREKYQRMENTQNSAQIRRLLRIFDEALLHPSDGDCREAAEFARQILKKRQVAGQ